MSKEEYLLQDLNPEQKKAIKDNEDVLVAANPGTGKTKVIAHKYIYLVLKGIKPDDILALTFTKKAKEEMEARIKELSSQLNINLPAESINVHTFHSFAMEHTHSQDIVSSNYLRYTILEYLKKNKLLNYSENYLISEIVPKFEMLIKYLKCFEILPQDIDLEEIEPLIHKKNYEEEEQRELASIFKEIFDMYENEKNKVGKDYNDLLLDFRRLHSPPIFEYVLIDELQDVNSAEANIAKTCSKKYFAVGDKKQAIFGFQGGALYNFENFENNASKYTLFNNYRSRENILDYSKNYFLNNTLDRGFEEELENLKSEREEEGQNIQIINSQDSDLTSIIENIIDEEEETAIIARTNKQLENIGKELELKGYSIANGNISGSNEVKEEIINFLEGVLSTEVNAVKRALLTPYSGVTLQEAFELQKEENFEVLLNNAPAFLNLRENTQQLSEIEELFEQIIFPHSISKDETTHIAALSVADNFKEAMEVFENPYIEDIINYIKVSELQDKQKEKTNSNIYVSSIHKAKGKQFDKVIYLPKIKRNSESRYDLIVRGILKTKGVEVEEELAEESLRLDFVAMTRAKNSLSIITEKPERYEVSKSSERVYLSAPEKNTNSEYTERVRRAYSLFLQGNFSKAYELLYNKESSWIQEKIHRYFNELEKTSYSDLPMNEKEAYRFLKEKILEVKRRNPAAEKGEEIHQFAENLLKGKEETDEQYYIDEPIKKNVVEIYKEISKYYQVYATELPVKSDIQEIFNIEDNLTFKGKIDAIFYSPERDEYLILDWKTNKRDDSKNRWQLLVYKYLFAKNNEVEFDKIKTSLAYVGLEKTVNPETFDYKIDWEEAPPNRWKKIKERVELLLYWKNNPEKFIESLKEYVPENEERLWKEIIEQLE